jgi:hypothetical protein
MNGTVLCAGAADEMPINQDKIKKQVKTIRRIGTFKKSWMLA